VGNIVIRRAIPAEKGKLEDLQFRASLTNAGDREAMLANPDAIDLPIEQIDSGDVFVLEIGGVVAGFAVVLPRPDGDSELDGLFVEPDLRLRGVGRSLVDHCAQIAVTRGSRALHVIGNPHAEGFYLSCGFSVIGQFQTRFGPGLLMRSQLPPAHALPIERKTRSIEAGK
jgi:GNAT superfamily N-acetyltransferase